MKMRLLADRDWKATGGGVVNLHKRHQESGVLACLIVVDNMAARWIGDEEMEFYFRPSTLFRPKHFDEYLNAKRRAVPVETTTRTQTFLITCEGCARSWKRSVVVPKGVIFVKETWNRKRYDEAFAASIDPVGEDCACMALSEFSGTRANVVVDPVPEQPGQRRA